MCRYGFKTYKPSFACFSCRKSFKKVAFDDYLSQRPNEKRSLARLWPYPASIGDGPAEVGAAMQRYSDLRSRVYAEYKAEVGVCPNCGGTAHDLGNDFKAPKQSDMAAWAAVEGALRVGHQFHTCGCDGPGFVPSSNSELQRYLRERLVHFAARRDEAASKFVGQERASQIAYWTDRVRAVEAEIASESR